MVHFRLSRSELNRTAPVRANSSQSKGRPVRREKACVQPDRISARFAHARPTAAWPFHARSRERLMDRKRGRTIRHFGQHGRPRVQFGWLESRGTICCVKSRSRWVFGIIFLGSALAACSSPSVITAPPPISTSTPNANRAPALSLAEPRAQFLADETTASNLSTQAGTAMDRLPSDASASALADAAAPIVSGGQAYLTQLHHLPWRPT